LEKSKIGIIAAPELPTKLAHEISDDLLKELKQQRGNDISWEVEVVTDALVGVAEEADELVKELKKWSEEKNWKYTFCLTDLPNFKEQRARLGHANLTKNITILSIPAFGWSTTKRIKNTIIQIVQKIYRYDTNAKAEKQDKATKENTTGGKPPLFSLIHTEETEENDGVYLHYYFSQKWIGRLNILWGMIYANRPWQVMISFRSVIAIAFATGAYGLIFPSLWMISNAFSWVRLLVLMVFAISIMIAWIIQTQNLWEKNTSKSQKNLRRLYNLSTLLTLGIGVISYYVILMALLFFLILIIVPSGLYRSQVGLSSPPDIFHYIKLGWLGASISTTAGALGSSFEDEEYVRNIAYGYRQNKRYKELKKSEKEQNKSGTND